MGELDEAGITDVGLRRSYTHCRAVNAAHGRTYYLSTLLLPAWKRPYVHALYGFARYADEIVDDPDSTLSEPEKAARLREWGDRFLAALRDGVTPDDVEEALGAARAGIGAAAMLPAVVDTVHRWGLPTDHFEAFLASMAMDLTVTSYATWDDLMVYTHGSASVIGLQMLPILEPVCDAAGAYARDLGVAFQLANFIRDVGEDLRRGRVYLPQTSLDLFGVSRERLATGVVDGPVRRLLAFEISRTRELFRAAEPGIRLLHPTSRECIRTALRLYRGILDEVERAEYQVLDRRVAVGIPRRLAVAGPALLRAARDRRRHPSFASR